MSSPSAAAALLGAVLLGACSGPSGMWRDQLVFVGDEGTVLPLAILRYSDGRAELKAWLGDATGWRSNLYRPFAIAGRDANDLERTLAVAAARPDTGARVELHRGDNGQRLSLRLRTRTRRSRIEASELRPMGEGHDPEGRSRYVAGRATLRQAEATERGFVLIESTPRDAPKRPHVEYGDFALLFLASPERGVVLIKRSLDVPDFDTALVAREGVVHRARGARFEVSSDSLALTSTELGLDARLLVRDRRLSEGVAPNGSPLVYETLLLGGELRGAGFLIHPRRPERP